MWTKVIGCFALCLTTEMHLHSVKPECELFLVFPFVMWTDVCRDFQSHNLSMQAQYSLSRAQQSFKSLVQIHEKNGWFTPPKEDG